MTTVANILSTKGHTVHCVRSNELVFEAVRRMVAHNVGALPVMEGDEQRVAGIITERDYLRRIVLEGRSSKSTFVEEIMSRRVVHVSPDTTVDDCMQLMTELRIRHLPVIEGDELAGIVSIGDLVKAQISDHRSSIEQLTQYIQGRA